MSEMGGSPVSSAAVTDQLDQGLSVAELVEVSAHCQQVRSAADYRMLQSIGRIHELREDEYLAELADRMPPTEAAEISEALRPRDKYGLNGLERAVTDIGAALCITPHRAKRLIVTASAARYRLRETAYVLADGVIDLDRLMIAIARTDLVAYDAIRDLDIDLADQLRARGPMSTRRFQTLINRLIHTYDPDALTRRRARVEDDRNITIGPDRFTSGQARVSGTLPHDKAAIIDGRLQAMAKEVHHGDGRTLRQLRADAYVALAQGHQHLTCRCDDCGATQPAPPNADSTPTPCHHGTRPYLHIVINLTSLIGLDSDPAYLDGHGLIDADTARQLLTEAKRAYLAPPRNTPAAGNANSAHTRYRPSRTLRALIQAGELCCQFPGCNNPVSEADLDHQQPFAQGGKTIRSNIGPLCRFHHRAKTFAGWQQQQNLWGTAIFTAPTGHAFIGNAYTGTDLFPALGVTHPDRRPEHPSRQRFDRTRDATRFRHRAAQQRWEQQHPPPF